MALNFFIARAASAQDDLMEGIGFLPREIRHHIRQYVDGTPRQIPRLRGNGNASSDPSVPPHNGACPLLKLSIEERRHILQEFLPSKDRTIRPPTEGNPKSRTCDLLVLNKQLCSELSTVLYEERTFAINVYEGLFTGGVEFLNSGLQRLQYQSAFTRNVFKRFEKEQELFGFQRLKRLHILVHPSKDELSKANRHDPLLTYFMLCTMLELLKKKDGTSELNYLKIEFAENGAADAISTSGRNAIMHASQYWWNPDIESPRETSIHGVSNVALILSAFECLNKVHKLEVDLPRAMKMHEKTIKSVDRLAELLDPKRDMMDIRKHDLGHKLEVAREALDEFIFQARFGNKAIRDPDVWIDLSELVEESHFALGSEEIDGMDEDEQLQRAIQVSLAESEKKKNAVGYHAELRPQSRPRKADRETLNSHGTSDDGPSYYSRDSSGGDTNSPMVTENARSYEFEHREQFLLTPTAGPSTPPAMPGSYTSIFGGPVGRDGNGAGQVPGNNARSAPGQAVQPIGHNPPPFYARSVRKNPSIQSQQPKPFLSTPTMGLSAPASMSISQDFILGGPVGEINGNGTGHVSTNDAEYLPSGTRRATENAGRPFPNKYVRRRRPNNDPLQHQQPGQSSPTSGEDRPTVTMSISSMASRLGFTGHRTNEGFSQVSENENVRESDTGNSFSFSAKAPRVEEDYPMPDA